jgi:formylglycine-generating enzyme required for sulfatase activity
MAPKLVQKMCMPSNKRHLLLVVTLLLACGDLIAAPSCEQIPGLTCRINGNSAEYRRINPPQTSASAEWFRTRGVTTPPWQRSVAVLVGVSQYQSLPKLEFVRRNISELRRYLLLDEAFDEVYVLQEEDVTQQSLENLMMNFIPSRLQKTDRFLFYYAGHGDDVKAGVGYMVFSRFPSANGNFDAAQAVDVGATRRWAQRIPAKHALFLLDGCALGLGLEAQTANASTKTAIQRLTGDPSRVVFAATRASESTFGDTHGLSYFTGELLQVLHETKADAKSDALVDIALVADIMNPRLAQLPIPLSASAEWYNKVPIRLLPIDYRGSFFFLNTNSKIATEAISTNSTSTVVRQNAVVDKATVTDDKTSVVADGTIKPGFVSIQPGEFSMGCSSGDKDCHEYEKPAHQVRITKGYQLGRYEVTQAEWSAVMPSNPSSIKNPNLPVDGVSWNQAQEFLRRLNSQNDGYHYRLPTEAEWEFAARAGSRTKYAAESVDSIAWTQQNSEGLLHRVGQKQPNAWGLYDMEGNVWEWVADWYADYTNHTVVDPTGPPAGNVKVLRGGSWSAAATGARVSMRNRSEPDRIVGMPPIGFRYVREPANNQSRSGALGSFSTSPGATAPTPRVSGTPSAPPSNNAPRVDTTVAVADQFKYEVIGCTGIANSVTCQFRITNLSNLTPDRSVKINCGDPFSSDPREVTRAIDNAGNQSYADICTIANNRSGEGRPRSVQANLVNGVTVAATATFSHIDAAANSLPLFSISHWATDSRDPNVVTFRSIPIKR